MLCCPFWCVASEAAAAAAVAAVVAVIAGILPPGVLFSQGLLSGQLAAQVILERTRLERKVKFKNEGVFRRVSSRNKKSKKKIELAKNSFICVPYSNVCFRKY